jgi:phenylacetate-CoA ligase
VKQFRGKLPKVGETVKPAELPVWTREDQQKLFERLPEAPIPGCYRHSTGGSTGKPMRFYVSRQSYEWRTAVADRGYSWAGAEEGRKSLYLWGMSGGWPTGLARIKRNIHLWLQRRKYVDVYTIVNDERRRELCALLNRMKPAAIVAYANGVVELARFVRDNPGILTWRARSIVTGAEGLQAGQRELIEEHLGGTVFESYGSREGMLIGMQCQEQRGYHLSMDNLFVEVAGDDGSPLEPDNAGRILITDLHNVATPFVRYDNGDLGIMANESETCPCGLPFPLLRSVEGRAQEVVLRPDGGQVIAIYVTYAVRQFPWIEGYQVVQDRRDHIVLKVMTKQDLTPDLTTPVTAMLRRRLGETMQVDYERVTALKRRSTGKVALVESTVDSNDDR